MSGAALRAAAARVVHGVAAEGRTLDAALDVLQLEPAARPPVRAHAWGTVRRYPRHCAALQLLQGPRYGATDPRLRCLLAVGLEQLADGRTPPHAAIMETVEATRLMGLARAAGFVNALLRRAQREHTALAAELDREPATRHAFPGWLAAALAADWPDRAEAIMAASNEHPPLWLRVNRRRIDPADYRARLDAAGLGWRSAPFAPASVRLDVALDVRRIPGFEEGLVSVQDAAAQLAAPLLDLRPGQRVLDACAAPGSKACHLLELEPALALTTLDADATRARRIDDNLRRLGLAATQKTGDATCPADWWDGQRFERILLDVPCSGSGVIRRHPDIKLLRRPGDVAGFTATQRRLLDAAFGLLAPGGRLVYATCSVLRAENAGLVAAFLADTPAAVDVTESATLAINALPPDPEAGPGFALLPGVADTDGFFYACLEKH
jgi:16S rRNA (cytosine967-C5)-methyltransferase